MKISIETKLKKTNQKFYSVWITDDELCYYSSIPESLKSNFEQIKIKENKKQNSSKSELMFTYLENQKLNTGWIASLKTVKYYSKSEKIKIIAAKAYDKAKDANCEVIIFNLDNDYGSEISADIAEGIMLGSYSFNKYKTQNNKSDSVKEIILFVSKEKYNDVKKSVEKRKIIIEAVNNAREIINETSRVVTPIYLAKTAKEIAKKYDLECIIYDDKRLIKEGYNGIVTVGRGSSNPPKMIILKYNPKKSKIKDHLFLVGKGLTFDTGGLCLKPQSGMWKMKGDMTGAAVALFTMQVIAQLKPNFKISMAISAAENAIGPDSVYPNEVFKAKNGKFIHVENTDAEGRLTLTDALCYAGENGATHIIDIATLTGSIVTALGNSIDGVFGNDEDLLNAIVKSGENVGEIHHIMPLHEEYRELLKHEVADLNNIGSTNAGGAITAALFLSEFVPEKVKWAHLDIAGVDTADKKWKYYTTGATAIPLRTLVDVIVNWK